MSRAPSGPRNARAANLLLTRLAASLLSFDLALVRLVAAAAQRPIVRASAVAISRWGNGRIYLVISLLVLERLGRQGWPVILLAAGNAGLLHCFYPYMKRKVGRVRPYRADPALHSPLEILDLHSFPSGHTMTLAATLVPIIYVMPGLMMSGMAVIASMAWARVATAHHYPSDVCAGAMIGGVSGYAMADCWFNAL